MIADAMIYLYFPRRGERNHVFFVVVEPIVSETSFALRALRGLNARFAQSD
jgi:hypothetical protein